MRITFLILAAVFVVGCSALGLARDNRTFLFDALYTQPDGYVLVRDDASYTIRETLASDSKLCRVVEIDQPGRFDVESFCKVRGGLWR